MRPEASPSVPIDPWSAIPAAARTRFAPAPTGYLHVGHLVNAVLVWGIARAVGGTVVLRIEDHDRQRSSAAFETAILDDLERLGLVPDEPSPAELRSGPSPYRQSDTPDRYAHASAVLRTRGRVYACDCTRSTVADWAASHGRPWSGPGCPGGCAERGMEEAPGVGLRVALGPGTESWHDLWRGAQEGEPAGTGDILIRDRSGNWTYAWCVVVDDLEHAIDVVIRGADLLEATRIQLRLARLLTGRHPATFLHHPLIYRKDGSKLSKADGATAIRELLDDGADPAALLADAARVAGFRDVPARLEPDALGALVAAHARDASAAEPSPRPGGLLA